MKFPIGIAIWFLLASSSTYAAIPYWVCVPQGKDSLAPSIIIVTKDNPSEAFFHFEEDWVRGTEKLPAGDYHGYLTPSKSGFSIFARLSLEKYFPTQDPKINGTWLEIALSTKSTLFGVEAYLMWYADEEFAEGERIGFMACRKRHGHSRK